MKPLIFLLSLFSISCYAAPFDLFISQRNIANSATNTITVASPGIGSTGVLVTNPLTGAVQLYRLNNSFFINNGTFTIDSASDWSMVTNKPVFSPVATSGDYNDLINKPGASSQVNSDWSATSGVAEILNKPSLSTVATSGAYSDLSGLPSIPAAQVQSDWNSVASPSAILNKPTLFSGAYSALTGTPSTFSPSAHTHSAADIVSGVLATARIPSLAISQITGLQTSLDAKFNTPSGTTAQYLRGDGSVATFPALTSGTVTSVTAGTGLSGGAITSSGTISMPSVGTAGSYSGVTTDAQGRVSAGTVRSQSSATRALNTAFQVSATRDALVNYSVQCTITASIAGGQSCDVILEIATDAAFTTGVQTIGIIGTGQTYTLAIAIQGVQPQTAQVTGYVPAGYYARLRTVNVSGSPAYAYRAGQEILQ